MVKNGEIGAESEEFLDISGKRLLLKPPRGYQVLTFGQA